MVPDAPYHYACDAKWWDVHYKDVKAGFKGESFTISDPDETRNPNKDYELTRLKSRQGGDLGEEYIHYGVSGGGNSGFQAINLAYHLGARTIILLGFDCFGSHYFGDHPKSLNNHSPFKGFIQSLQSITKEVEIINCSRMTALECFPKTTIERLSL